MINDALLRRGGLVVLLIVAISVSFTAPAQADLRSFRVVAMSGTPALGTQPGVTHYGFSNPRINNLGQVVFRGSLSGPDVSDMNDYGIWSEGGGSLHLMAREGMLTPGFGEGIRLGTPHRPDISDAGESIFLMGLVGPGIDATNNGALWSDSNGTVSLVVREGDQAPGLGPNVTLGAGVPALNRTGHLAFFAKLKGEGVDSTNDLSVWTRTNGNLELVAQEGAHVPGMDPGVYFESFTTEALAVDSGGNTIFYAHIAGPGIDSTNNSGLWSGAGGTLAAIARSGMPAPGMESGMLFRGIQHRHLGSFYGGGQTAFGALLAGPGVDATNNSSVWSQAGGNLHLVARTGDHAPGLGEGAVFNAFDKVEFNDSGEAVIYARVANASTGEHIDSGIWSEGGGEFHLVVRNRHPAPEIGAGVTVDADWDYGGPVINGVGHTAFMGFTSIPGKGYKRSIVAEGPNGLRIVVREGDQVELPNGTLKTIYSLDFNTGSIPDSGRGYVFNDRGQVTFWANFTDFSSGLFVADPSPFNAGDYNADGVVDAADYVVWRDNLGTELVMPNDQTPGLVSDADYDVWKAKFGRSTVGLTSIVAVPEPGTLLLALAGLGWMFGLRCRRVAGALA